MRVVSFVQVLLLLAVAAYLLLVTLENPALVRLPLPLGRGEVTLPVGLTALLFLLAGMAYAALLLLPPVVQEWVRRGREARGRQAAEAQLTATLQARLGSASAAPTETPAGGLLLVPTTSGPADGQE